MSAGSATRPTEQQNRPGGGPEPGSGEGWPDADAHARALERLTGVRSSKPSFYAAWREKSARLDRTIETLERISSALCATPEGPDALCEAVVEAAGHHFNARWAAMILSGGPSADQLPRAIVRSGAGAGRDWDQPPPALAALAARARAAHAPVVVASERDASLGDGREAGGAVAVPMPLRGERDGALAVGLPVGAQVEASDLSILVTLANHAGVALHNEGTRRRLEETGRRQLLSHERNRIARELHDSVAQHLLTIGMNLEWCRRHESISRPVLERVLVAQSLARSAVDEIRAVIFELASDGQVELRRALREVIDDVEAGTHASMSLRCYGRDVPLSAVTQHAIVQIAREALFNVARHADADRASVTVRWGLPSLKLIIADDGCGRPDQLQRFLRAPRPAGHHLGLAGIGERVRALGGSAAFERRRGGGVKLKVELPVASTAGSV